jgi:hypothetical protein
MVGKEFGRKFKWLDLIHYFDVYLGGLRKTMRNLAG